MLHVPYLTCLLTMLSWQQRFIAVQYWFVLLNFSTTVLNMTHNITVLNMNHKVICGVVGGPGGGPALHQLLLSVSNAMCFHHALHALLALTNCVV